MSASVRIWGLPLAPMTRAEAADAVSALVAAGKPSYFITANVHYAMLTHQDPSLHPINAGAAFLLADGAPLVWASRWKRTPLPERVAGSDLIFDLCERAARAVIVSSSGVPTGSATRRRGGLATLSRTPGRRGRRSTPCSLGGRTRAVARRDPRRVPTSCSSRSASPRANSGSPGTWRRSTSRSASRSGRPSTLSPDEFAALRLRLQKVGLEWAYRLWLEPSRLFPRYTAQRLVPVPDGGPRSGPRPRDGADGPRRTTPGPRPGPGRNDRPRRRRRGMMAINLKQLGVAALFSRWGRRCPFEDGYTIILPSPMDMPFLLRYALEGLGRIDTSRCKQIVVIPDGCVNDRGDALDRVIKRFDDPRIELIRPTALDYFLFQSMKPVGGAATHWMMAIIGTNRAPCACLPARRRRLLS